MPGSRRCCRPDTSACRCRKSRPSGVSLPLRPRRDPPPATSLGLPLCEELQAVRISIHYFSGYDQNEGAVGTFHGAGLADHNFLAFRHVYVGRNAGLDVTDVALRAHGNGHLHPEANTVESHQPFLIVPARSHATVLELIDDLVAGGNIR